MRNIHGLRQRRSEQGAAAVEFALIAILLCTLLFGIIQFSLWFWAWQAGGHAAREAARVAAVSPCDTAKIQSAGTQPLTGPPAANTPTVTVSKTSPVKVGDGITVRVQFNSINVGFFPWFNPTITKSATSRVENVPAGGC
ncbi:TadE family protein [Nocardioides ungokensis]|uniref:TadE family protein n=1 Tax=Nocardioides ungokensis TaxID=1643322 RepID=UPI0015DE98BF|nr:TadE family protein [Nocardioides ungokensis]